MRGEHGGFAEDGLKQLLVPNEELFGRYLALDMVNAETGEIYAEAGDEVNEKVLEDLTDAGFGIRFTTPAFPIRLDWGYGFNHRPGERLYEINFGLGNLF